MAVLHRAAMSGRMLQNRQAACIRQPLGTGARHRDDQPGICAIAAVSQERVRGVPGNVGRGCAIHVDAVGHQLCADQQATQIHGAASGKFVGKRLHLVERRQPFAPVRRAHALHPTAFLVDQDQCVAAHAFSQRSRQPPKLVRRLAIALK